MTVYYNQSRRAKNHYNCVFSLGLQITPPKRELYAKMYKTMNISDLESKAPGLAGVRSCLICSKWVFSEFRKGYMALQGLNSWYGSVLAPYIHAWNFLLWSKHCVLNWIKTWQYQNFNSCKHKNKRHCSSRFSSFCKISLLDLQTVHNNYFNLSFPFSVPPAKSVPLATIHYS